MQEKKKNVLTTLVIQAAVIFFTLSGVMGKFASAHPFLSFPFIGFYALEMMILGIYAVVWQQIIKRVDLSVAYANRSLSLLWSLCWSILFFHVGISPQNIAGAILVIAGVFMVNSDEVKGKGGGRQEDE